MRSIMMVLDFEPFLKINSTVKEGAFE